MYMKPKKNRISITIDYDIIDKIREISENDDRSLSQYINIVLKNHIAELQKDGKLNWMDENSK